MKKSKIFWALFSVILLIFAAYFNIKKGPFEVDFAHGQSEMGSLGLVLFHYIYVLINIGFFMLSYIFLFQKHTAIFLIGTVASIVLANIAYLVIFNSSSELAVMAIEIYSIIIWPDLLLLLTKRIKWIFVSPAISMAIIFLIPGGQGAYWIGDYFSEFADVFLWTPIIWVIGALTIFSQRQISVKNENDKSHISETVK